MKKSFLTIGLLSVIAAVVLAGCSKPAETGTPVTPGAPPVSTNAPSK